MSQIEKNVAVNTNFCYLLMNCGKLQMK